MTNNQREDPLIYFADDLVAIYTAFRDFVYQPRSALYLSCGYDASPSIVFPRFSSSFL